MLIDLTHTFTADMPVWPGDPCARLYQTATVKKDGFSDHKIDSGMHVGTHMDAPLHMLDGGAYIADFPVSHFQGRGILVDARGCSRIDSDLLDNKFINAGDIVLVMTGWNTKFGQSDYFENHPVMTAAFAERLAEKRINVIGMDTPSPDTDPFPIHKIFLKQNILIIENLTNLEMLNSCPDFIVHAYPMKYQADAAPVRVVADTSPLQKVKVS